LRFDHYEHHGPILSPRFNLKWKPGEWSTLRFNFGTGFRVVNLFTEDHAFVTGRRQVEIEDPLEPEQSYNASLSFNQVYTLGNGSGTLDIEAFYTHFENKIVVDYSTPGMIIYRNVPEYAQTMGIGLSVNHRFSFPLSFNLGINVQEVTQSITEEEEVISIPIEFAPKWTGLLSMNYEFKKLRMTVGYNVSVTGPMQLPKVYDLDSNGEPLSNPRPTTSPTFAIHSLKVSKNFNKGWAIYAGMENIFDYRQPVSPLSGYDDPNHSTGFSPHFDSAYSYAPMHGREFYVGAKWLFGGRK
jgi:outer membrane receptor for ferrienterochelin and colicins